MMKVCSTLPRPHLSSGIVQQVSLKPFQILIGLIISVFPVLVEFAPIVVGGSDGIPSSLTQLLSMKISCLTSFASSTTLGITSYYLLPLFDI